MITLRLGDRHSELHEAKALTEALLRHPGSCDTVWFSSLYGFPPLEVHAEAARKMGEAARIYREAGIGFSMQISNTLGHGEYMKSKNNLGLVYPGSPAENMVGPDGTVSPYAFCWRGEHFRAYTVEELKLYAANEPDMVWYDDDLRADNHLPAEWGCFCDNCIAGFNALHGTGFTRETLVHEINYGDVAWRQKYIDYCRAGISDFVKLMTRTVKEVSPRTKFGMQHAHWCNFMGPDDRFIMDAIQEASGEPAQSRPGGGYYRDKVPLLQYEKTMRLGCTMSRLPDAVKDRKAEIENLPDIIYGKSIGGTIVESTLHLANGCTGLTYATIMSDHEPMAWHEKMFEEYSRIRPYWERLGQVSKTANRGGLRVFRPEKAHLRPMGPEEPAFNWVEIVGETDSSLMIVGIPVTHDQRGDGAYLIHHKMIPQMSDADIRFLLTQPVVTDAASVKALMDRGFGDCFKLKLESRDGLPASERFTDHPVNAGHEGRVFVESSFFRVEMPRYAIGGTDGDTEILSEFITTIDKKNMGGAAALTRVLREDGTPGGKWAVFGYCLWNDMISSRKRDQILRAADAVKPLPAMLLSNDQAAVIPSVNARGETVSVTVSSASIGGSEELELLVRNPAGTKPTVMNTQCVPQEPLAVEAGEEGLRIRLRGLLPYEIVTVFL